MGLCGLVGSASESLSGEATLEVPVRMCFPGFGVDSEEWLWTRRRTGCEGTRRRVESRGAIRIC